MITLENLTIGATLNVYYEPPNGSKTMIAFRKLVDRRNESWATTPLKQEWINCGENCFHIEQWMCEGSKRISVTGNASSVLTSLPPPRLVEPICAGSRVVEACDLASNPSLRLMRVDRSKLDDEPLSRQGSRSQCSEITVGDEILLKDDELYLIQKAGNLESRSQPPTKVVDASHAEFFIKGGTVCRACAGGGGERAGVRSRGLGWRIRSRVRGTDVWRYRGSSRDT